MVPMCHGMVVLGLAWHSRHSDNAPSSTGLCQPGLPDRGPALQKDDRLGDSHLEEGGRRDGLHQGRAMGWDMATVPATASSAWWAQPGSRASQHVLMIPQATCAC